MSDSLQPHGLQHTRLSCPSLCPGVCSKSCPLSWWGDAIQKHLFLCHPLLLLPSIFPSTRVFPKELVLRIRCSEYWSFSFSVRPFNEYSGLISFRIDWFDLAVQGTLKNLLQHHNLKASVLWCLAAFRVQVCFLDSAYCYRARGPWPWGSVRTRVGSEVAPRPQSAPRSPRGTEGGGRSWLSSQRPPGPVVSGPAGELGPGDSLGPGSCSTRDPQAERAQDLKWRRTPPPSQPPHGGGRLRGSRSREASAPGGYGHCGSGNSFLQHFTTLLTCLLRVMWFVYLWLCWVFVPVWAFTLGTVRGGNSCVWASHCRGFSCCGAGGSELGSTGALLLCSTWDPPWPGIEPVSPPAWAGRFFKNYHWATKEDPELMWLNSKFVD